MTTPRPMGRDEELGHTLETAAKEANEQIKFHRSQLIMWERTLAAASAGLGQLAHAQDDEPMDIETSMDVRGKRLYEQKGNF